MLKKWNIFKHLAKNLKLIVLPIVIILRLNPIEIPKMYKIEDPLVHIPMLMRGYSFCCYPADLQKSDRRKSRAGSHFCSVYAISARQQLSLIQSEVYFQTIHTQREVRAYPGHQKLSPWEPKLTARYVNHTLSMAKWTIQVYRRCCHGIPITSFPAHPSE